MYGPSFLRSRSFMQGWSLPRNRSLPDWVDPVVPLIPGLVWFNSRNPFLNSKVLFGCSHGFNPTDDQEQLDAYIYFNFRCKYGTNPVCKVTYICKTNQITILSLVCIPLDKFARTRSITKRNWNWSMWMSFFWSHLNKTKQVDSQVLHPCSPTASSVITRK